jgi:Uma2 family endonuclease
MSTAIIPDPSATTPRPRFATAADLVESLGGIPIDRIRLDPSPGTATESDVLRFLESGDKRIYELVDGTLVEKAMGLRESLLAILIAHRIMEFVEKHDLGVVSGSDGPFRMLVGNVRSPDVSFIPWSSMPSGEIPDEKIWSIPPALAIEVLSDSNTPREINRKLGELFLMGCRLVWVIDPAKKIADVYSAVDRVRRIESSGVLEGEDILSGFTLPLTDLFAVTKKRS